VAENSDGDQILTAQLTRRYGWFGSNEKGEKAPLKNLIHKKKGGEKASAQQKDGN